MPHHLTSADHTQNSEIRSTNTSAPRSWSLESLMTLYPKEQGPVYFYACPATAEAVSRRPNSVWARKTFTSLVRSIARSDPNTGRSRPRRLSSWWRSTDSIVASRYSAQVFRLNLYPSFQHTLGLPLGSGAIAPTRWMCCRCFASSRIYRNRGLVRCSCTGHGPNAERKR